MPAVTAAARGEMAGRVATGGRRGAASGAVARRAVVLCALVLGFASATAVVAPGRPVGAARPAATATSRAAVIIDTGSRVVRTVITFDGSISGAEALRRAGADPVFTVYAGEGAAVCSLLGVGHGPGDCFGVAAGDGRYWGYFRAGAGSSSFRYWGAGASSTTVHDGDVEGWSYGARPSAPPFTSVAELAGDPPAGGSGGPGVSGGSGGSPSGGAGSTPGTRPAASQPPGVPGSPGPAVPGGAPAAGAASVDGERGAAGASDGASGSPAPVSGRSDPPAKARGASEQRPPAASREVASRRASDGSGGEGGPPLSLAVFAAVAAVLAGGIVVARRARSRRA